MAPITYSFILLVKSLIKYPSFYEYQLLISAICLIFWTIIVIPIYITPQYLTATQIILVENISTIIGSFGVLFFIFSIINNFSYKLVLIPRLTIIGFSIIIGSKLIQLSLLPTETIYGIRLVGNQLIRVSPSFFSAIIGFSYLSLYISLVLFIRYQNKLPEYIIPQKIKQYSLISLIIMTIGMTFQTIGTIVISEANLAGWTLILARLFITTGFIFIVFQFTKNPVLSFSEKGNPTKFIINGTVNWLLLGNMDLGPEPLQSSSGIDSFFNQEELQLFSLKLLTSVSLGSEKFSEEICIIPHGNIQKKIDLCAVGFSFLHSDPTLADPRKNGTVQLLFAVIIPAILLPFLANITLDAMKKPVITELKKTRDLTEFLKNCSFDTLTAKLLKNLTQKKSF